MDQEAEDGDPVLDMPPNRLCDLKLATPLLTSVMVSLT